jgi:ketosteroid isomerase-like protein
MPSGPQASETMQLLEQEQQRQAALIAGDFVALDRILADDLIHVHGGGNVDSKAQYLELLKTLFVFVAIERRNPDIRFLGDTALMTGEMTQTVRLNATGEVKTIRAFGTQVWARRGGEWRQVLYQATEIAAPLTARVSAAPRGGAGDADGR